MFRGLTDFTFDLGKNSKYSALVSFQKVSSNTWLVAFPFRSQLSRPFFLVFRATFGGDFFDGCRLKLRIRKVIPPKV